MAFVSEQVLPHKLLFNHRGNHVLRLSRDAAEIECHDLTRRAIFFSLFIAENCFKRVCTAGSKGSVGATPSTATHGWSVPPYSRIYQNA